MGKPRKPPALFKPRAPLGSAVTTSFFADYPRFLETSQTAATAGRLNLRYDAIFGQNRDIIEGARVLDIASHDGRWSFAALQTGASHVTGIEPRGDLVGNANGTFAAEGIAPDRYRFIEAVVFEVTDAKAIDVDVALCLGFLYHTLRYGELLRFIRDLNPGHLIIDTEVFTTREPVIHVRREPIDQEKNAVPDRYSHADTVLSGRPTIRAIRRMVGAYGFKVEQLSDWPALLRDNPDLPGLTDYREGRRATVRCVSKT